MIKKTQTIEYIGRRKCLNNPDSFGYICGSFTIPSQRSNISAFVKQAYFAYFKLKFCELLSYCNMTKTIGSSVLTLKWCASFLVSNVGTQSILAFSLRGIAELERSIDLRRIDLQDLILNLEIPTFYMSHLLTGRK